MSPRSYLITSACTKGRVTREQQQCLLELSRVTPKLAKFRRSAPFSPSELLTSVGSDPDKLKMRM